MNMLAAGECLHRPEGAETMASPRLERSATGTYARVKYEGWLITLKAPLQLPP